MTACMLHAASKSLQNSMDKTFGESLMGEDTFQKILHTCWSAQEALGENFEAECKSLKPGVPDGRILDLDSESCIGALPAHFARVEAN